MQNPYLLLLLSTFLVSISSFQFPTAGVFANPVQGQRDSPDPGVNKFGNSYYAVTTMGWDGNFFPIWQSKDLTNWTHVGWGIKKGDNPQWTKCCDFWAPQIHRVDNKYLIYYTARTQNGFLSIGVRHSTDILGPYTDKGSPLMKNDTEGVIDATIADDQASPGLKYLIYKVDGNAHGQHTPIFAIQLSANGMQVLGPHRQLITNDKSWEGAVVEAPWIFYKQNYYYLFYSGNGYHSKYYAVGVARSRYLLGPYEKYPKPILSTRPQETAISWEGPGHCSVIKGANGNDAIIYHAWPHNKIGSLRVMMLDQIEWDHDLWPKVNSGFPTEERVPIP